MLIFKYVLLLVLVICAISVSFSKNLLNSIIIFMSYSLIMSVIWILIRNGTHYVELFFFCYGGLIIWGGICALAGWTIDRKVALEMVRTLTFDLIYIYLLYQYLTLRHDLETPMRVVQIAAFMAFAGIVIITWPEVLTDRIGGSMDICRTYYPR